MLISSSTIRMAAMSSPRQLDGEARPAPGCALEVHAAAVSLHDVAHDGEAEAGGADLAARLVLGEALEDALLPLGGNAGAVVGHRQHDRILSAAGGRDRD